MNALGLQIRHPGDAAVRIVAESHRNVAVDGRSGMRPRAAPKRPLSIPALDRGETQLPRFADASSQFPAAP
jgi:hypothetical protein